MESIFRSEVLELGVTAVECDCGGYCEEVDCTAEEIKQYGCGLGRTCCVAAFVCKLCKKRFVHSLEAPEME